MANYNTWLPGDKVFTYGDPVPATMKNLMHFNGSLMLCVSYEIPNRQSGLGITYDATQEPFTLTVPPKLCYQADVDFVISLKDSDGWMWEGNMPKQDVVRERGWEWAQFVLSDSQDPGQAGKPLPEKPAAGVISAYQFRGAAGVHGSTNDRKQKLNIAYLAGRSPVSAANGDIRTFRLTDEKADSHNFKVGDVKLAGGSRREIKYLGALPFAFQSNGPRNRLAVLPYRGPVIAGYQSGTPWVYASDNKALTGMLDFMLAAQQQFRDRHPKKLMGPFMHCYLWATWDCEQTGPLDTWVWDAPDGNPAWNGWQYRAFDSMGHTWYKAIRNSAINSANRNKLKLICERFLTWLYGWIEANPKANYIPSEWGPPGWSQGQPLPPDSYLDPHGTSRDAHDLGLALKGAIFCALAGTDKVMCRTVIRHCILALQSIQVSSATDPMRGAFTLNPAAYEVYGFHQGEIMDALGLALAHPELMK